MFLPIRFTPGFEIIGFSGLASHGGAIGILIVIIYFSRKYKIELLKLLDMFAIATPLAGMCIRVGNFFNSEIIGKETDGFYSVIFKRVDNIPRHPAQLYEALAYFCIFIILVIFKRQQISRKPGFILGLFLVLLFSVRFFIEFVKENQAAFEKGLFLNMGQLLSIPFILAGVILLVRVSKKNS
jgi:prolipoprotein diacylglyceryl transferase